MKLSKQIVSIILLLTMLIGMVPASVSAAESSTSVETGQTTIEGTNGFGSLLSEDIQEHQSAEESNPSGGYNVIGLKIENNIAVVEYSSLEEAVLVVSLYTEDGVKMLLSGKTEVSPEETEAIIELEGEIPEYFMASAFLLDTYDYSPLCTSYDTPMYTKEMQELLASTTDDYDADKVLQLDENKTTNFAVYADETIILEYEEGVNTVVSANDETATYVIENADSTIMGLSAGDILAYAYGVDQILIVKVAAVTVDGTTVTITGADLEMEEVFSHVKLETTGNASDIIVDESTAEDGIIYEGLSEEEARPYSTRAVEGESGWKTYLSFKLDKEWKEETDHFEASVTVEGSLGLCLDIQFSYYISTNRQFIEFKTDTELKTVISIEGEGKVKMPLPALKLTVYGISIGFEPKLQLEFSGEVEYSVSAGFTIGISYENGKGIRDLTTSPKIKSEFKVEASIFLGIDLAPTIEVLSGAITEAELEVPIGIELKTEQDTWTDPANSNTESIHACQVCTAMELVFKAEITAKLKFLKCKWLSVESEAKVIEIKIGDLYWSIDQNEFGWGICPYRKYRVTVQVKDANGQNIRDKEIVARWEEMLTEISLGKTNSNGIVAYYLPVGTYTFTATVDGKDQKKEVKVAEACKVMLDQNTNDFASGLVNPDMLVDSGPVIASGECGAQGDNVLWSLTSGGLLTISGTGDMQDYDYWSRVPWYAYRNDIFFVSIGDSVTSIGSTTFCQCDSLTSLTIPNGVTSIGSYAFDGCDSLIGIIIPDSVAFIGDCAFYDCMSLTGITVSSNNPNYSSDNQGILYNKDKTTLLEAPGAIQTCVIPDSVTTIGVSAFHCCDSLVSVTISDSVTTIDSYAFYTCDSLASVTIGNSVETIGNNAFAWCESLSSVVIPNSVTSIGPSAFSACHGLKSVYYCGTEEQWNAISIGDYNDSLLNSTRQHHSIANGVCTLCGAVNNQCVHNVVNGICTECGKYGTCGENLTWTLDDEGTLTISGTGAMTDYSYNTRAPWDPIRSSIKNVNISNGVTTIGDRTFYLCDSLTSVTIPDSVTTIGSYAFYSCASLTSVTIPDSVTTIGSHAFYNCDSLTSVTIPDGVTSIESGAFSSCNSLTSITVSANHPNYSSDAQGILYNKDKTTLIKAPGAITTCVIPNSVTYIDSSAFSYCISLTSIAIPDSVASIGDSAFFYCTNLISATIGNSVTTIGSYAFDSCSSLTNVTIGSSLTSIGVDTFAWCDSLTNVTYCGTKEQWNTICNYSEGYNDPLFNATLQYHYMVNGVCTLCGATEQWNATSLDSENEPLLKNKSIEQETPAKPEHRSIYHGEYGTEITETYMLKTASFAGLVAGEEYVLLSLISIEVDDVLAPANLLYIDQATAAEDGTLVFTYAQREDASISYVMACGASHNNVQNATINFPTMTAGEELQSVEPVVVHDGKTLVEGIDYVIVGTVDYTTAGTYTCFIRGIYNYSGVMECTYTVFTADDTLVMRNDGALNLAAYIGAQFSVTTEIAEKYDTVYIVITHNGEEKTFELTKDSTGAIYFAEYGIAAKQMADAIDIALFATKDDVTYVGQVIEGWTIKAKLVGMLDQYYQWMSYGGAYKTTPELAAAMLAYGAAAQNQFSYNLDNLATDGVQAKYLALVPTEAPAMEAMPTFNNTGFKSSLYNPAFMLDDVIKASLTFAIGDKNIQNYKARVTINGVTEDYELTQYVSGGTAYPGYAYIIIDSIVAADLRNDFTVTIMKGETATSTTYTFSMENMAAKLMASRPDMITAIMNYADAAHARFRAK